MCGLGRALMRVGFPNHESTYVARPHVRTHGHAYVRTYVYMHIAVRTYVHVLAFVKPDTPGGGIGTLRYRWNDVLGGWDCLICNCHAESSHIMSSGHERKLNWARGMTRHMGANLPPVMALPAPPNRMRACTNTSVRFVTGCREQPCSRQALVASSIAHEKPLSGAGLPTTGSCREQGCSQSLARSSAFHDPRLS